MHHSNSLMLLICFHLQNINHHIMNMLEFNLDNLFFLSKDLSQFYNLFLNFQITVNLIFFIIFINHSIISLKSQQIFLIIVYTQIVKFKPKNINIIKIFLLNLHLYCIHLKLIMLYSFFLLSYLIFFKEYLFIDLLLLYLNYIRFFSKVHYTT